MDYVGLDPAVGLECSHCNHISRMPYSDLLRLVAQSRQATCTSCGRLMLHDWTTVAVVQNPTRFFRTPARTGGNLDPVPAMGNTV
ncbi:MAG: hypothetical protein P8Y69_11510 [Gammaproteobacteria bacterium]